MTASETRRTIRLTKTPSADTNSLVADSPQRLDPAPWSDVDQAFFASAPPDIPEPPPEPMRFDDLEAVVVLPARRRPTLAGARHRTVQLTAAAWRQSAGAWGAARGATARTTRTAVDRFINLLAAQLLSWRGRAIVGATIVISIALPAMLVGSRPAGRASAAILPSQPAAIGGESTIIAHASPAVPLPLAADPDPPAQAPAEARPHHAAATKRRAHKHKHHARARKDLSAFQDRRVPASAGATHTPH